MKTAMTIEDRDTGFLFLDPTNAPPDAVEFDFTLAPGVLFRDVEDDEKVVWLQSDKTIRVVPRDSYDHTTANMDSEWPIPTCLICVTTADYETLLAE
jgi:hypothetical protein